MLTPRLVLRAALAVPLLCAAAARSAADEPKVIRIHTGRHWVWYAQEDQFRAHEADYQALYEYADRAFERLVAAWGLTPAASTYALYIWPKSGGGFATANIAEVHAITNAPQPGIGVSFDAFTGTEHGIRGWWAVAIITHEMCNLVLAQLVSHGWPVDWWANHISPFPKMTAVQIEYDLRPDVAVEHARQLTAPLDRMFVRLKDQFGWALFRRAFTAARDDGINWERIGDNPSALRTNYVAAYLQLAAPEDLGPYLQGIVPAYDAQAVARILAARREWHALPDSDPRRTELRAAFLGGGSPAK